MILTIYVEITNPKVLKQHQGKMRKHLTAPAQLTSQKEQVAWLLRNSQHLKHDRPTKYEIADIMGNIVETGTL